MLGRLMQPFDPSERQYSESHQALNGTDSMIFKLHVQIDEINEFNIRIIYHVIPSSNRKDDMTGIYI